MKRIFFILIIIFSLHFTSAWSKDTHIEFCPNAKIDCIIADSYEFQRNNPNAVTYNHVCYDNKEDCMARLSAKYFLKKYYLEGETNKDYLGAAAHLFQDSYTPTHWYPGFKILGEEAYLFAPSWAKNTEGNVGIKLSTQENWNIPIKFKGEILNINRDYLEDIKQQTSILLSQEPEESLEEIQSQIASKKPWHYLRAFKDLIILLFIIFIPILGYGIWKYKKEKEISSNLIIPIVILLISTTLLIMIKLFY